MPPKKIINIKNPYNPMHNLYKKLTRLWAGPLVTAVTPKTFELSKKNLDKYQNHFKTASDQPFERQDVKHPSYYLYTDTFINAMRAERYFEFDQMEMHPDCAAILETYADELCSHTDLNPPIKIISNNLDIKECLNTFFYKTLKMKQNLHPLAFNVCKYGDLFAYLDVDEKLGVTNIIQLPPGEVERLEGQDPTNPNYVQFQWNRAGQTYEYGWNVVHFRNLMSDKYAPYGQSIHDSARRAYHQLNLLENAVIGYRIVRAPERKVYYVDIGGINDEDVVPYINEIKKNLKESVLTDGDSGRAERRYNAMPISKNSIIPLLDGRNITIEELSKEYESGKENWVYSISDETHEPLPGKIKWCGRNYTTDKLIKVTLDDDSYVETAPEHPFILKDGSTKRADQLLQNDSLMPFYRQNKKIHKSTNDYESLYDNKTGKYVFTHRFVANNVWSKEKQLLLENLSNTKNKNLVVHHKSFNRFNNDPKQLEWIGNEDHIQLHSKFGTESLIKYNKSQKHRDVAKLIPAKNNLKQYIIKYNNSDKHSEDNEIRRRVCKERHKNTNLTEILQNICKFNFENELYEYIKNYIIKLDKFIASDKLSLLLEKDQEFIDLVLKLNINKRQKCIKFHKNKIRKLIQLNSNFDTYEEFILSLGDGKNWIYPKNYKTTGIYKNHKVVKIETIHRDEDVYCMTVVGANDENDRHNFAILSNFEETEESINGYNLMSGIYLKNSIENDIIIPVRGQNSGTKVESLPGGQWQGSIDDLKHARDKLFSAYGVPASYFSQDSQEGDRQALAQKDIKFGKRILRIQNSIVAGLTEIAMTHLAILGFDEQDLDNFEIKLHNPSRIAEMQELEQMRTRLDLANSSGDYFSKETQYKKFLGMSDEEIQKERILKFADAKYDLAIQQFEDTGEGGGGLGGGMPSGGGGDSPFDGMSDAGNEDNPFNQMPEDDGSGGSDSPLIEQPSDSDIDSLSQKKLKDDEYLTPGAKGKAYSREKVDKRFAGARMRHNKAVSPMGQSKANRQNIFGAGFQSLRSLSKGIMSESNEPEDFEDDEYVEMTSEELLSLNESLINEINKESK